MELVGLGVAVVFDAPQTLIPCSDGEFYWGGAASTAFWCDPGEDMAVLLLLRDAQHAGWRAYLASLSAPGTPTAPTDRPAGA